MILEVVSNLNNAMITIKGFASSVCCSSEQGTSCVLAAMEAWYICQSFSSKQGARGGACSGSVTWCVI